MKISILYHSETGRTEEIGRLIKDGIESVDSMECELFNIQNIDLEYLNSSKAVIFGSPTYMANTTWKLKRWLDESHDVNLEGKIGAIYATANYIWGGAETSMLTLINHLMVKGMLVYSGGATLGRPYIHLGYVSVNGINSNDVNTPKIFGERVAKKVKEIFG